MRLTRFDTLRPIRMSKTPEGFLRGEVPITRCGVFNYLRADGSIKRELRHPNDVFDSTSLDSLKMIPVVDDNSGGHPKALVDAANAKELSVGTVGEQIRIEDGWVLASVVIRDAETVKRAEKGERVEVSAGYIADVEDAAGHYDGQEYDSRQRYIRYNHLAIVDSARMGPEARLRLDSSAAMLTEEKPMIRQDANDPKTVTVKLDGIDYVASPEVARALERATQRADQADKDLTAAKTAHATELAAAKAEGDKQKGRADAAEDALKKEREGFGAKVKARAELLSQARRVLGDELKEDEADDEIRKAVIRKHSPAINLDANVSTDYVRARFDAVLEGLGEEAIAQQREQTIPKPGDKTVVKGDSKAARERYIARLKGETTTTKDKE